jgi:hypothetical protein
MTIVQSNSSFHTDCLCEIALLRKDSLNRTEFMNALSQLSSSHLETVWTSEKLNRRFQSIFNLNACSSEQRGWLRNPVISIKSTEEQITFCEITGQALRDLMVSNDNRRMNEIQAKENDESGSIYESDNICLV